eukprot:TRINITY_DN8907_c0_g1_i1.p1 TRINITY_DN8907_c0_g1~~TRINITY_DN8907_c0_g1_i1.p1  ORF type:complete len:292 (+),score=59.52 TRINITY_DN8907_c0_g1_i1:176-1051(+)
MPPIWSFLFARASYSASCSRLWRAPPQVPPSYSTFGTAGTSKKVGNPGGDEPQFDKAGGAHKARKAYASIGRSVGEAVNPQGYLKKHTAEERGPGAGVVAEKTTAGRIKPIVKSSVPKVTDKPVHGLVSEKNFVVANAVDNILTAPKHQTVPAKKMTQKKDYGQVPGYLRRMKEQNATAKLAATADATFGVNDPMQERMRLMTPSERKALNDALHGKWLQLNKQYQSMTFTMDTVTKVARKEVIEKELDKVEKAMARIKNKKCIFVYDDMNTGFEGLGVRGTDLSAARDMM